MRFTGGAHACAAGSWEMPPGGSRGNDTIHQVEEEEGGRLCHWNGAGEGRVWEGPDVFRQRALERVAKIECSFSMWTGSESCEAARTVRWLRMRL